MNLEGTLKKVMDEQAITASFKKREFVITTQEQYPQDILLEFTQDKTTVLDQFKIGELVSVDINVRGREWINPEGEAKYFNTLQAWKIAHRHKGSQPGTPAAPSAPQQPSAPQPPTPPAPSEAYTNDPDDDDLPF